MTSVEQKLRSTWSDQIKMKTVLEVLTAHCFISEVGLSLHLTLTLSTAKFSVLLSNE